jgi:hypothetical protein
MEHCFECDKVTQWKLTTKVGFYVKCRECGTEEQWEAELVDALITPQFA